ncbi:MAG: hypothetical protein J07HN6_01467 [Halonotius sp. J07HN6]|jgi:hypothetical protein|nr:MAG: hypothetical protein J07HN6_01467 [Halonotius sp. J07HN6]ERH05343.1 MAG: hypothetical protein J07HN4v3_00940 [Halonotius sp. J07HN4]ESS07734.1 MAG: hypothetical protein A07HN63_02463 [uncultured archaeon A07HN63]
MDGSDRFMFYAVVLLSALILLGVGIALVLD